MAILIQTISERNVQQYADTWIFLFFYEIQTSNKVIGSKLSVTSKVQNIYCFFRDNGDKNVF